MERHPITIRCAESGESFVFDPPEKLWLDMLAFSEASGVRIEEIIVRAIGDFLDDFDRRQAVDAVGLSVDPPGSPTRVNPSSFRADS